MRQFRKEVQVSVRDGGMVAQSERASLSWWQRLGFYGFMFFLIKGLLWLIVPAVIVWWRSMRGE